jgi:DnaJ-class molecular chaperone
MKTPIRLQLDGEITEKRLKEIRCPECIGYGDDGEHCCDHCGGTGYAPQNKPLEQTLTDVRAAQ